MNDAVREIFPENRLMFEFTENEKIRDPNHINRIFESYKRRGFTTAIDDFGAGNAGLSLLADLQPDVIKIDMSLIRGIDHSVVKRTIVASIVSLATALNIVPLAEGIENIDELNCIRGLGISLCQGYIFAKPAIEALPVVRWSIV